MRVRQDAICNKSFSCDLTMLRRIKRPRSKHIACIGFLVAIAVLPFAVAFAQEFSADMISRAADGKVSMSKFFQTPEKVRFDSIVELRAGKTIDTHMIF